MIAKLSRALILCAFLIAGSIGAFGATVRGRLLCNGGQLPATGIAVTLINQQGARTTPFFTGGDGMFYFTVPPGPYVLEIWLSRSTNMPTNTYNIFVSEPITDLPPLVMPVCYAQ